MFMPLAELVTAQKRKDGREAEPVSSASIATTANVKGRDQQQCGAGEQLKGGEERGNVLLTIHVEQRAQFEKARASESILRHDHYAMQQHQRADYGSQQLQHQAGIQR